MEKERQRASTFFCMNESLLLRGVRIVAIFVFGKPFCFPTLARLFVLGKGDEFISRMDALVLGWESGFGMGFPLSQG